MKKETNCFFLKNYVLSSFYFNGKNIKIEYKLIKHEINNKLNETDV